MEYVNNKATKQTIESVANSITSKTVQNKTIKLQDNRPASVLQRKNNNTGLPDNLKSGIENLSGHSMDDVKVHYNSGKPAALNAHAFAQGTDIHIASGQEKHLPHEAWHIIQQKQGKVKPTLQMKGKINMNDDPVLEKEADMMGAKALTGNQVNPNGLVNIETQRSNSTLKITQFKKPGMRERIRIKMQNEQNLTPRETKKAKEYGMKIVDWDKRRRIDKTMKDRVMPTPTVGISNRGARGFINDTGVFDAAKPGFKRASMPLGFNPLKWGDPKNVMDQQLTNIRSRRENVKLHLNSVDGLFIPGGQDREKNDSPEKISRERYEMSLVKAARNRGMPMMAVCGGSRALAKGFGAKEQELKGKEIIKTHKQKDQTTMGHSIDLRDPKHMSPKHSGGFEDEHTIVGGAAPKNTKHISNVNSTHEKIVAHKDGQIEPVNTIEATGKSELMTSAWSPEGFPEAFETRYGAPIIGITSHPEAMHTDPDTRKNTPKDAQNWSDNLFKGFAQSMQAYRAKQSVNAELLGPIREMARKEKPKTFVKWQGKRNWQKLLHLGMISPEEAEEMKAKVEKSKQQKSSDFRMGIKKDKNY